MTLNLWIITGLTMVATGGIVLIYPTDQSGAPIVRPMPRTAANRSRKRSRNLEKAEKEESNPSTHASRRLDFLGAARSSSWLHLCQRLCLAVYTSGIGL
jgi:hypothetical protein